MYGDSIEAPAGVAATAATAYRFALTLGVAALGVVAVVALAGREGGARDGEAPVPPVVTPAAMIGRSEFRFAGEPAPPPTYLFIVGSEAARRELTGALEAEAVVRTATDEPARVTWVVIAGSDAAADAIAEAVQRDAAMVSAHTVTAVEVIDLR
jgi:hypothetical protein